MSAIEIGSQARVYSVTKLHAAAEAFEKDLPFQVAIVEFADGTRKTVRIQGSDVKIDDPVEALEHSGGVWYFGEARTG